MLPTATLDQATTGAAPDVQTFLVLRLGAETFALPSAAVREVMRWRKPTVVPGAPPLLPGIISQRGVVLPVVDLRSLLGFTPTAPDRSTRYIIVQHDDVELVLLVDAVNDLVDLSLAALEPPPAVFDAAQARLLRAIARIGEKPVALFDLSALIIVLRG